MSESDVLVGSEGAAANDNLEEQQDIPNEPGCSAQREGDGTSTEQRAAAGRPRGLSIWSTSGLQSERDGLGAAVRLMMDSYLQHLSIATTTPQYSNGNVAVSVHGHAIIGNLNIGGDQTGTTVHQTIILPSVESQEERNVKRALENAKKSCPVAIQNQKLNPLEHLASIDMRLRDYYVDLEVEFTKQRITKKIQPMKLEEIFDSEDDTQSNRILIQGDAGFGKTTLLAKLAFDWHHRKPYIRDRFDLVLHFALRTLANETTLFDTINAKMGKLTGEKSETVLKDMVKEYGQKILILIDGLDEAKNLEGILQELMDVDESNYSLCTFVLTSRPQQLKDKGLGFVTKFVKILGMSEQKQQEYIELYFKNFDDKSKNVVELIARRLFKNNVSPLLLFIICFIAVVVHHCIEVFVCFNDKTKSYVFI